MSRKQPSLLDLLLQAPWWVSLLLSPIAFVLIAGVAPAFFQGLVPNLDLASPLRLPAFIAGSFFLLISGFSAIHGSQRKRLVDEQQSLETLRDVSWKQFEFLVAEAFRREGYAVSYGLKGGSDGGVDLDLRRGGRHILVQCKRWKKNVGAPTVRELYGIMQSEGADGGALVTTSGFTREAHAFAAGKRIEMIDGPRLLAKVRAVQTHPPSTTTPTSPPEQSSSTSPTCPKCGNEMVQRTARRGAHAGNHFWGCRQFPKCRGTLPTG